MALERKNQKRLSSATIIFVKRRLLSLNMVVNSGTVYLLDCRCGVIIRSFTGEGGGSNRMGQVCCCGFSSAPVLNIE